MHAWSNCNDVQRCILFLWGGFGLLSEWMDMEIVSSGSGSLGEKSNGFIRFCSSARRTNLFRIWGAMNQQEWGVFSLHFFLETSSELQFISPAWVRRKHDWWSIGFDYWRRRYDFFFFKPITVWKLSNYSVTKLPRPPISKIRFTNHKLRNKALVII